MTSTLVSRRVLVPTGAVDRLRIPFGLDKHAATLYLRLDDGAGSENPGILIIGGSRIGKTSLQVMLAAQAASRGTIVVIIDPKQRFARAFRRPKTHEELPHVLVYWSENLDRIPAEWHGILQLLIYDQRRRFNIDGHADSAQLGDLERFPPVLIIVDEMGRALELADQEWNERKPDQYKGNTPLRDLMHESASQGGEAHHVNCWSNQTPSVANFPKQSTDTRALFGQRIALGNLSEDEHKRSLFGPGVAVPRCPDGQKGAGNVAFARHAPMPFQALYESWEKEPELLYELAARGIPRLREHGHIDNLGRLLLGGIPVPRPGQMASHVSSSGLDLITDEDDEQPPGLPPADKHTVGEETGERGACEPRPADERVIVGIDAAAEQCGMSRATFLAHRQRHPIPHTLSKYQGNKPGWCESDLSEWALYRAQSRRPRSREGGR